LRGGGREEGRGEEVVRFRGGEGNLLEKAFLLPLELLLLLPRLFDWQRKGAI